MIANLKPNETSLSSDFAGIRVSRYASCFDETTAHQRQKKMESALKHLKQAQQTVLEFQNGPAMKISSARYAAYAQACYELRRAERLLNAAITRDIDSGWNKGLMHTSAGHASDGNHP
ncbi:hypothetical protein RBI14_15705 [Alcaligenaceae bacterium B3P038]|nr:hypothetical protein [Alcaligenaceae bacterium B3P038]